MKAGTPPAVWDGVSGKALCGAAREQRGAGAGVCSRTSRKAKPRSVQQGSVFISLRPQSPREAEPAGPAEPTSQSVNGQPSGS